MLLNKVYEFAPFNYILNSTSAPVTLFYSAIGFKLLKITIGAIIRRSNPISIHAPNRIFWIIGRGLPSLCLRYDLVVTFVIKRVLYMS